MPIHDDSDRHNLYLQKLASGLLSAKIYPSLEAARKAARAILLDAEELKTYEQVLRIQARIAKEAGQIVNDGWSDATSELSAVASYESEWQVEAISAYSAKKLINPKEKQIQSYIDKSLMSLTSGQHTRQGVWADFVFNNVANVQDSYNGIIMGGYRDGQTVGEIAREIKRTTEGMLTNNANSLARTGMSHYTNGARDVMAQANIDILKYRVFSSTFDNRTTLICRSLGGQKWAINDDSYPRLPLHFGERSSYFFVTSEKEITQGKQAAVGGKDVEKINPARKLKYRGKKDTDIFNAGQISGETTQAQWLRAQPIWFVENSLGGKDKAKLFLDGGLDLDAFVSASGKPITLARLRELDAEAFKKAKL